LNSPSSPSPNSSTNSPSKKYEKEDNSPGVGKINDFKAGLSPLKTDPKFANGNGSPSKK